jgi:hypothetical protein
MAKAQHQTPQQREVTIADKNFALAVAVLRWAMVSDFKAALGRRAAALTEQPFPKDLAQPFDPTVSDKTHKVASDLAGLSLGFILLHEIAHLELLHSPFEGPESIQEEREADAWAASFLLEKSAEYAKQNKHRPEHVRMKRLLALVVGELWLLHFEVHLGVKDSETHPPTYDRLANILDQQAEDGGAVGWSMAATALSLHYQAQYGAIKDDRTFRDFREWYQHYADLLSKKPTRRVKF